MKRTKYSSLLRSLGGFLFIVVAMFVVSCRGFNVKTRETCCALGTNYSSSGSCKTFKAPIPGIVAADEKLCLNIIDICCKKQFRVIQCELGEEDAKRHVSCPTQDGDRKDCCEACQIGIDTKATGEPCDVLLEFGSSSINCCRDPSPKKSILPTSTTPKTLPKLPPISLPFYPGLSEENVCETGEYCAQLCEHNGKSFNCACFDGYELMKDGVSCKPIKHAKGSRCLKNNPCDHDCTDTGTSIVCSCKAGYELGSNNRSCIDIDECELGTHNCGPDEDCENDIGTYICFISELDPQGEDLSNKCPAGHKFNPKELTCDDINECEFELICSPPKICKNSIGSYMCEGPDCPPGFKYKAAIESCSDIDECVTGENDCNKDSQVCVNTKGNYTCVDKASGKACPPGFKKNSITYACEDINECEDDIKVCFDEEKCVNEEGGYKCLQKNRPTINNITTSPKLEKRICPLGFKYNETQRTCDDINECQLRLDNCSTMHRCDNTIGSFYCTRTVSCGTGYTLNSANDLCEDDDECSLGTHNCYKLGQNYKCQNQMGTYKCELVRPTYRTVPATRPTTTTTVRSTTASTSTTTTTRSTTVKSPPTPVATTYSNRNTTPYQPPYVGNKQIDNTIPKTNNDIELPKYSKASTPRLVFQVPQNIPYWSGFSSTTTPSPQITTSVIPIFPYNIYPTNTYTLRPKAVQTTPRNPFEPPIIGLQKKCLPGYRMNDKRECEDINECESNPCPAGLKCLNFKGRYECSSPLQCKIGYELNESADGCVDVNECARNTHKCNKSQLCKNGDGYYTCECPPGHHLSVQTQMCEDIDECKFYRPCGSNSDCVNTRGSFQCFCKKGFYQNNTSCEDINECKQSKYLCEQRCVNLWGSYRCACALGYTLRSDNRTCEDVDECEKFKDRKLCIGSCHNVPGSYKCECPKGYNLGHDGRVCVDIDECQQRVCGYDAVCVNTRGGHKCYPITCDKYYMKDPSNISRCKRITCDPRDNNCQLMPEQYAYQFMTLVSNFPVPDKGMLLFKIKGPNGRAATAEFTISLVEVQGPPNLPRVDNTYFEKIQQEDNLMEIYLVKAIQGPQEIKLKVEMKLFQGRLLGSTVVYLVIVVSDFSF